MKAGRSVTVTLAIFSSLVLLLAMYLLSTGPAWWLVCNDSISSSIYAPYVAPAWWLAENTGSGALYVQYLNIWAPVDPSYLP